MVEVAPLTQQGTQSTSRTHLTPRLGCPAPGWGVRSVIYRRADRIRFAKNAGRHFQGNHVRRPLTIRVQPAPPWADFRHLADGVPVSPPSGWFSVRVTGCS